MFLVPSGKAGKQFVQEIINFLSAYTQRSAKESVAMEAVMVASTTLLQKPHAKSDCKEHVKALERRLKAWADGEIDGLMREGRTIQDQLNQFLSFKHHQEKTSHVVSTFAKLVMQGKIHAAHRFTAEGHAAGILDLHRRTLLRHPQGAMCSWPNTRRLEKSN